MELRSNGVNNPYSSEDVKFGGRDVYFNASDIHTGSDGRAFVSGVMVDVNSNTDRAYFFELKDPDFSGFADKNWKQQQALFDQKMPTILLDQISADPSVIYFSDGETFDDIEASIQAHAKPPEPVKAPEPEGPKPANLEAGEPIKISAHQSDGPVLLEEFEVNGQRGDLVVHDIEFDGGRPFLSGTFSVGDDSKEFAVAVDANRFPNVTELTNDQVKILTSTETLEEMLETAQHPIVLSTSESFPDRAKILSDINGIRDLSTGAFNGDIPHLARLGQEYPGLVETLHAYEPSWAGTGRSDDLIKLAVLEHLGVEDAGLRVQLIDQTNGLDEFAQKLNQRTDLFSRGPETRAAVAEMAERGQAAADFVKPPPSPRVGPGVRLFAGLTGVGTALTAVGASAATYEGMSMVEMTHQQFEGGVINEEQRDALVEFHNNTTAAQLADVTVGAADQFILPSMLLTLSVEREARDALTEIANKTGLSEDVYQMHARSMFEGHTASHDALLSAADELPLSTEGQPEIFHDAITLKTALNDARNEYLSIPSMPGYAQSQEEARALYEGLQEEMVSEMDRLMRNPDTTEAFLNVIPVDERMDFVKALAVSDPDIATTNPLVAEATREYVGRGGTKMHADNVRAAKAELSENNGEGLNDYIASRILPESSMPEAPSNAWDEDLVAQYYNPETLHEMSGEVVGEFTRVSVDGLSIGPSADLDIAPEVKASLQL